MKKITMYLGLNDKDSKIQKFDSVEAYKVCINLLGDYFGGGTISTAQGFYKHDNGEIVIENSLRLETISDLNHGDFVQKLKVLFNQESILVELTTPEISFE